MYGLGIYTNIFIFLYSPNGYPHGVWMNRFILFLLLLITTYSDYWYVGSYTLLITTCSDYWCVGSYFITDNHMLGLMVCLVLVSLLITTCSVRMVCWFLFSLLISTCSVRMVCGSPFVQLSI